MSVDNWFISPPPDLQSGVNGLAFAMPCKGLLTWNLLTRNALPNSVVLCLWVTPALTSTHSDSDLKAEEDWPQLSRILPSTHPVFDYRSNRNWPQLSPPLTPTQKKVTSTQSAFDLYSGDDWVLVSREMTSTHLVTDPDSKRTWVQLKRSITYNFDYLMIM